MQTCQYYVKDNRLCVGGGETAVVLPAGCPCNFGVIAGNHWSKSQLFPGYKGGGGGGGGGGAGMVKKIGA